MAGVRKLHEGVALPRSADARGDAGPADLSSADLSNVVPFARLRATRQVPEVILSSEATRPATGVPYDRVRLAAFVALSLMVHAGLLLALSREPAPLASIGEQVISLEIVVGASAPAGVAQTPGEQAVQAAAAPEPQQPKTPQEPEKATDLLVKEYPNFKRDDELAGLKVLLSFAFNDNTKANGWGAFDPKVWQDQITLYDELKQFTAGAPKLDDVITTTILEQTKDARPKLG